MLSVTYNKSIQADPVRRKVVGGSAMELHHEVCSFPVSVLVVHGGAIGEPPDPPPKGSDGHQSMVGPCEKGHILGGGVALYKVGPLILLHHLSCPRQVVSADDEQNVRISILEILHRIMNVSFGRYIVTEIYKCFLRHIISSSNMDSNQDCLLCYSLVLERLDNALQLFVCSLPN